MEHKSNVGLLDPVDNAQEVPEAISENGARSEAAQKARNEQLKLTKFASDVIREIANEQGPDAVVKTKTIESVIRFATIILQGYNEIISMLDSPEGDELRQMIPDIDKIVSDPILSAVSPGQIGLMGKWLNDITPHLLRELSERGTDQISIEDFFGYRDGVADLEGSVYMQCLRAADTADAEAGADVRRIAEVVQCMAPAQSHTMPNNALMNALQQKSPINAGAFDLVVANETKRRKEITSYAIVTYDDPNGSELLATNLTEYERQVSDAVVTLWEAAKEQGVPPIFTTDMIHRAMPGGGDKPSPQQRGAITKAMEKLRHLHITVDATEEMRQRGHIGKNETLEFDDFYLSAARVRKRFANRKDEVSAYELHAEPLILNYANRTKQVIRTSSKHLEIRKVKDGQTAEVLAMSAGRQAMTGYMLRRILIMRNDKEKAREALKNYNKRRKREPDLEEKSLSHFWTQSRTILFDTVFRETGMHTDSREQARRNRDFCFEVLDYWKVSGLISGYTSQTKGRSITGVRIDL